MMSFDTFLQHNIKPNFMHHTILFIYLFVSFTIYCRISLSLFFSNVFSDLPTKHD